jgi:hypothetical protein
MTLEAPILAATRLEASNLGGRLFRNNRGLFYTMSGSKTRAGLEADGASDLIGGFPVVVTPEMVGHTVFIFTAVETKKSAWTAPKGETEEQQQKFINFVNKMGGIAFFLNNANNLKKMIDERIKAL